MDVFSFLDISTPESLLLYLYGPVTSYTPSARWTRIFIALCDWLMHNDNFLGVKRQYLLLQLQARRLHRLIDFGSSSSEDILIEAETQARMLLKNSSFCAITGSPVAEYSCCLKRDIYKKKHGHEIWDEESPKLLEILNLYNLSLIEVREGGRLVQEGNTLIKIATTYFPTARKLHAWALEPFFKNVEQARIVFEKALEGWKFLQGWDKVQKFLLAVEEQTGVKIHSLAIDVFCGFLDTHQDLRNNCDSGGKILWLRVADAN